MIVRILNEGQWRVSEETLRELNQFDDAIEKAVSAEDAAQLAATLQLLHDKVRDAGTPLTDDELEDSDLILPDSDSTLDEVRSLLNESEDGLIPG